MRITKVAAAFLVLVLGVNLLADDKAVEKDDSKVDKKEELTLEKLYPEKSMFGPGVSEVTFSADGKYGAYLYRPYIERRHGSDIWLYDVKNDKQIRVTSAAIMAEFQEEARKVCEDRVKKAKAEKKKDKKDEDIKDEEKKGDSEGKEGDKDESDADKKEQSEDELKNYVSDKDADDSKAPRYSGVSSYIWAPKAEKMLFVSDDDIYSYDVKSGKIDRLTMTNCQEKSVAYLPDGSGYTYRVDNNLMRVKFGSHLIEQLDPKFPSGETMSGYEISPDGNRIAFTAYKWGPEPAASSKTVDIANYRDRFMNPKKYTRQTADMPFRTYDRIVYLYEINDLKEDNSVLKEVFRRTHKHPCDITGDPKWSANSKKIVFDVFTHDTGEICLYEACVKEKEQESKQEDKEAAKADKEIFEAAKVVYRYMHTAGPTTPRMTNPQYLSDNKTIVYLSEQTGFRHLHVLDPLYESSRPLTSGYFEVYPVGLSKNRDWMIVTATKEHPSRKEIYRVSMKTGKMTRLSREDGNYREVAVTEDGSKTLARYIRFGMMPELVYIDSKAKTQKVLTDSHSDEAKKLLEPVPEFFDYKNRHGHTIYGHMFKPDGWNKDEKRPLLIYIYGGPLGTQKQVADGMYQQSSYFFGYYMAKKHGYITCTIDPRGNSGYGGVFEKANYEQVGKPQVEDLVDGVKFMIENYGVDKDRVAIHGWSFGGFETQMCLYTEPDVFAAGMAGAGPTEWENYNSHYTTQTIDDSRVGKTDLGKYSLLPLAKNLKSHLLLVHGMEDSNVLYQDTVRVYRELLKAGKETLVELFLDPTGGHALGGDVKPLNRFRKYEDFLLRVIGSGNAEAEEKVEADAGVKVEVEAEAESGVDAVAKEGVADADAKKKKGKGKGKKKTAKKLKEKADKTEVKKAEGKKEKKAEKKADKAKTAGDEQKDAKKKSEVKEEKSGII